MVLLVGLGACGLPGGEDEVDADDASQALEQQRTDVREAARALLIGAEKELSGTTRNSSGRFRGCESAFPDEFRNFQYLAQARIDTGPGSGASYLEKLRPVLEDAGFTVEDLREEPNGFTTLAAGKGDLSASFVHTGGPLSGLDVSGRASTCPRTNARPGSARTSPTPRFARAHPPTALACPPGDRALPLLGSTGTTPQGATYRLPQSLHRASTSEASGMANSFIGRDMAVDLGTANTLVYVRGKGVLLDEPSVVALNASTGEILAVGHEAKRMIGRTPDNIAAIRPLQDGVIADFEATEQMLRFFIQQVHRRRYFAKPRMVVCVPSGITAVEQRAVKEAGYQAGARRVYIVEEPMAAAIGAGLPVHQATGNMVVDVGGGTTEVAVISLGGIVTSLSIRTAGDDLDQAIVAWMKKEYSLMLGERTAEEVKMTLGSAFPLPDEPEAEIRGRDMVSGLPRTVVVSSAEVRQALEEPLHASSTRSGRRSTRPRRARRRHHGPRHRAHRRRRVAPWARRAAAPRDRDARPRRRGAAHQRGPGRRQVRGGVRGAPAGAGLGAEALLMGLDTLDRRGVEQAPSGGSGPTAGTAGGEPPPGWTAETGRPGRCWSRSCSPAPP